ncbi:hypothetical protein LJ737_20610 [Hymenobacter sp. 15J16-1T3B]|uniref:hypothetical protein n=1 Tax=Hymenobacter sp. 15J16-1T3B TaxID=2886941 RepID=UPI001D11A0BE|nr:hypothetical protein [Hymenobacter sp. 15J16-1T3B]MCC3159655.1 hypothetical protein [Hymenobacter sp. 15J16-1T3B]
MAHWDATRLKVYGVLLLLGLAVVFILDKAGVIDLDKPSQNLPNTENPGQGQGVNGVERR